MNDHDDTPEEPDWLIAERLEAALHAPADEWEIDASLPPPASYTPPNLKIEYVEGEERTSWWPVNLAPLFDGTHQPPTPTVMTREDGQHLLYPGKCHAFNGESESGKTWAALIACVQELDAGGTVLYLDFEDTADTVVTRLLALGAKPDHILGRFAYIQPSEPVFTADLRFTPANADLAETLEQHTFTLAVIDGVTEAMTMHGLSLEANADYARFHGALPRRLALAGAAVVQIDHVTKNAETRGRYAIGAQHKLAAMDGAVFSFNNKLPFGLGRHGWSEVTVVKDRPGQIRQHAKGKRIYDLHLDSDRTTHALAWRIEVPPATADDNDDIDNTPAIMEAVSRVLEAHPQGVSKRSIRELVPAGAQQIDAAIELLRIGWVDVHKDGNRHIHISRRPYRVGDTTTGPEVAA